MWICSQQNHNFRIPLSKKKRLHPVITILYVSTTSLEQLRYRFLYPHNHRVLVVLTSVKSWELSKIIKTDSHINMLSVQSSEPNKLRGAAWNSTAQLKMCGQRNNHMTHTSSVKKAGTTSSFTGSLTRPENKTTDSSNNTQHFAELVWSALSGGVTRAHIFSNKIRLGQMSRL